MNCPVCNKTEVTTQKPICTECGSDLSGVFYVNRLDKSIKKTKRNFLIVITLVCIVVIAAVIKLATLPGGSDSTSRFKNFDEEIAALKSKLQQSEAEINALKSKTDSLRKKQSPAGQETEKPNTTGAVKIHTVKSGDTLWKLSWRYLGDAAKFKRLAEDNNMGPPYFLKIGQQLKIACE